MSDNETGPGQPFDPRLRTRNRAILVAILVLSMLPLFGAVWFYYGAPGAVTDARMNNGALIDPPAQLDELGLSDDIGPVRAGEQRLWRLIFVAPASCDAACFEQLALLRQLHVLLGREQGRVIRLAAFPEQIDNASRARLQESFPRLDLTTGPAGLIERALAGRALRVAESESDSGPAAGSGAGATPGFDAASPPATGVLTVDPLGNVIFLHRLDQIGEPLLFDLKRLLRLSNIG